MYSFLKNKEGELMLIFNPSLGDAPELSMFLYDDSGTGLLLQDLFTGIRIKNISQEGRLQPLPMSRTSMS